MSVLSIPAFRFRVAQLNPHRPIPVKIVPDKALLAKLAEDLEVTRIDSLRLAGNLVAKGEQDWVFDGRIDAVVTQPCVVTLEDVRTTIGEAIRRVWVHDYQHPDEEELEMWDEDIEPLGAVIDMGDILSEAFALALPQYPRLETAPEVIGTDTEAVSGATEDTRRPFADLAALLQKRDPK